ncbi:MRN complex-interacting protein [Culex pipiens pallens]|uniref:MRN complex-interacting protein n=1 Tax=Culex pipiens pallens TaxID=42434 RepID=UPI0022AA88A6|nr:MRN complex-interacting protein [Culex pipiens pallens]
MCSARKKVKIQIIRIFRNFSVLFILKMPQVLRVVCCFQCRQFQSDIVKKSNKWTCNRCNTKQTLRKEYGRGSGLECRLLAQQLSAKSCETEGLLDRTLVERLLQEDDDFELPPDEGSERVVEQTESRGETTSKWGSFLAKEKPEEVLGLPSENAVPQARAIQRAHLEPVREDSREGKSVWEPRKSSTSWQPKRNDHVESPARTHSIPLMNFHQMGKQDKKEYKWESRKNLTSSAKVCPKPPEEERIAEEKPQTQRFFSFKPKVPTSLKRSPERIEEARVTESGSIRTSEEECNKKIKLDKDEDIKISSNERYTGNEISHPISSVGSASKWNKFVVKHEEDDGIM